MKDPSKNGGSNLIPPGWQLKTFGDLFEFSGGFSASRDQLSEVGHCYLHYGDIHGSNKSWVDTNIDLQDIPKLDISLKRVSNASLLKDGDVVFVDASEDNDGTSKHIVIVNKYNVPFISGLHTIVAKSKSDEVSHEYRRYCFQVHSIKQQFLFYAVGTKVSGISKANIRNILIAVPPINEQLQISQVLINIDALLEKLDKTILKKRNIKQAAMQQLLTGKTRLPGFSGGWKIRLLGDIAHIKTGKRNNEDKDEDGLYPFFVRSAFVERINTYSYDCEAILVPGEGQIGNIFHYINGRFDVHQRVYAITHFAEGVFARYIYLFMSQHFGAWAMQNTVKATVDSLRLPTFKNFEVRVPPSIEEQIAISNTISDMDVELSLLEVRRDKTRDLKQAMMQELFTGKTRLIDKELGNA